MAEGAATTRTSSMWPLTVASSVLGATTVTVLLAPLSPAPREWFVRGLLVLWAVGVVGSAIAGRRAERTASNRAERVAFQTVSFWAFITGAFFVFRSDDVAMEPAMAVIVGAASALLFGATIWVHDAWLSPPGS